MKRLALLLTLLVFSLAGRMDLGAQFNGPADTASDSVNAPHGLTTDLAILFPARHDTVLRSGDLVTVTIYGITDFNVTGRISEEGFLTIPLVQPIKVDDLSVRDAQNLISRRLQEAQMFNNAPVQISVTESVKSQITLLGEVRAVVPGLGGSRRLFDVLAASGGLQPTTSHLISIDRPGLTEAINIDLGTDPERSRFANIPVFPGDTILTSRIGNYYLIGAWKTQGPVPLQNTAPLTLLEAYSQAGGKYWEAKSNDLQLIRTTGTTRTVTVVKMDDVLKGAVPDPVLQADDILYLPSDKVRAAIRSGGLSTALGIAFTLLAAFRF